MVASGVNEYLWNFADNYFTLCKGPPTELFFYHCLKAQMAIDNFLIQETLFQIYIWKHFSDPQDSSELPRIPDLMNLYGIMASFLYLKCYYRKINRYSKKKYQNVLRGALYCGYFHSPEYTLTVLRGT